MDELMIKVDNVTKEYRLGAIGGTTLRDELQRLRAKRKKQEDPTLKIGQTRPDSNERFLALGGVSFQVKKGEAVGIIGHNGAGKSTLLKLITRITAPTTGDIYLNGRVASMLEVGTGFHPELTGRENVYLNGAILGMTKKEIDEKMEDIIEFSEVRQFIDTPVKRYSSGMYVKLAFSVAAHLDSEIMIMDEVLAVGDVAFQNKCIKKMREVADSGRTILYVSHNMNTIRTLCDRCIVLSKGTVLFDGEIEKAIPLYLGANLNNSVVTDCRLVPRPTICSGKVQMEQIKIIDREESLICDNELLRLHIQYAAHAAFNNLAFRMTVSTNQGEHVGMCASDSVIRATTGRNSVDLNFNLSHLAPGNYVGRMVFYEVSHQGHEIIHDVVDHLFSFRKEDRMTINDTTQMWKARAWGNIHFPTIEVENNQVC